MDNGFVAGHQNNLNYSNFFEFPAYQTHAETSEEIIIDLDSSQSNVESISFNEQSNCSAVVDLQSASYFPSKASQGDIFETVNCTHGTPMAVETKEQQHIDEINFETILCEVQSPQSVLANDALITGINTTTALNNCFGSTMPPSATLSFINDCSSMPVDLSFHSYVEPSAVTIPPDEEFTEKLLNDLLDMSSTFEESLRNNPPDQQSNCLTGATDPPNCVAFINRDHPIEPRVDDYEQHIRSIAHQLSAFDPIMNGQAEETVNPYIYNLNYNFNEGVVIGGSNSTMSYCTNSLKEESNIVVNDIYNQSNQITHQCKENPIYYDLNLNQFNANPLHYHRPDNLGPMKSEYKLLEYIDKMGQTVQAKYIDSYPYPSYMGGPVLQSPPPLPRRTYNKKPKKTQPNQNSSRKSNEKTETITKCIYLVPIDDELSVPKPSNLPQSRMKPKSQRQRIVNQFPFAGEHFMVFSKPIYTRNSYRLIDMRSKRQTIEEQFNIIDRQEIEIPMLMYGQSVGQRRRKQDISPNKKPDDIVIEFSNECDVRPRMDIVSSSKNNLMAEAMGNSKLSKRRRPHKNFKTLAEFQTSDLISQVQQFDHTEVPLTDSVTSLENEIEQPVNNKPGTTASLEIKREYESNSNGPAVDVDISLKCEHCNKTFVTYRAMNIHMKRCKSLLVEAVMEQTPIVDETGHKQDISNQLKPLEDVTNTSNETNIIIELDDGQSVQIKPTIDSVEKTIEIVLHQCDVCKKVFKFKRQLSTHMRSHRFTYSCENCNQSFDTKQEQELHMKMKCNRITLVNNELNNLLNDKVIQPKHLRNLRSRFSTVSSNVNIDAPPISNSSRRATLRNIKNTSSKHQ